MTTDMTIGEHQELVAAEEADRAEGAGLLRRCVGSDRYGIEPHEAPVADFPLQPSAKDGIGRMCKPHWREYTNGLRRDDLARRAGVIVQPETPKPAPRSKHAWTEPGQPEFEPTASKAPKAAATPKPKAVAKPKAAPKPRKAAIARTGQESPAIEEARALISATEKLGGKEYTDAVASDAVQDALRVLAGTSDGPAIHEAMRERFEEAKGEGEDAEVPAHEHTLGASLVGDGEPMETPIGETIDGGTEEADAYVDSTDGSQFGM